MKNKGRETKEPIRTCVGCTTKRPQRELIRLGEGRGAYLCPDEECFEKAMKRKAFARALRREVRQEEINAFREEFEQKIEETANPSARRDGDGPC
jgi:predicted RNA-binding protein YlxR (DUF448 family)